MERKTIVIDRRWDRVTAVAGIAAIVLLVAALANWGNLYYSDPLSAITGYYVTQQTRAFVSQFLFLLFGVAIFTFGAGLYPILRRAESEAHVLSTMFFAGTAMTLVWMMLFASINSGLAAVAGQSSPGEIKLTLAMEGYVDLLTFLVIGITVAAASLAMLLGASVSSLGGSAGSVCSAEPSIW